MNILVLNGSPRPAGHTAQMVAAFREGAEAAGHRLTVFSVCEMEIRGCRACEACHTAEGGCVQADAMQQIYPVLREAELLVLASPIYYHNLTGPLKCAIDRIYAVGKPGALPLRKVAMFLASGAPGVFDGALFSLKGDFEDYLGLEVVNVTTFVGEEPVDEGTLAALREFGRRGV